MSDRDAPVKNSMKAKDLRIWKKIDKVHSFLEQGLDDLHFLETRGFSPNLF